MDESDIFQQLATTEESALPINGHLEFLIKCHLGKFITCLISLISMVVILLLFSIVHDLRKNSYSLCWITLSGTGIIHHTIYLVMNRISVADYDNFRSIVRNHHALLFIGYFILEFSLYLWVNVICYDVFTSFRYRNLEKIKFKVFNKRNSNFSGKNPSI